jgi:ribosomal protein L22
MLGVFPLTKSSFALFSIHQHKYSTAKFKISPRKLNKIAHQISGLPVGDAILQMKFSEKRASERIKSTLALARNHAVDKGLEEGRLVVGESKLHVVVWFNKANRVYASIFSGIMGIEGPDNQTY